LSTGSAWYRTNPSYGMSVATASAIDSSSRVRSDSETSNLATSDRTRNDTSGSSAVRRVTTRSSGSVHSLLVGECSGRLLMFRMEPLALEPARKLWPGVGIHTVGVRMRRPATARTSGFFGRIGLIAPAVLAPVAETALLRVVSPAN